MSLQWCLTLFSLTNLWAPGPCLSLLSGLCPSLTAPHQLVSDWWVESSSHEGQPWEPWRLTLCSQGTLFWAPGNGEKRLSSQSPPDFVPWTSRPPSPWPVSPLTSGTMILLGATCLPSFTREILKIQINKSNGCFVSPSLLWQSQTQPIVPAGAKPNTYPFPSSFLPQMLLCSQIQHLLYMFK